MIEAGAMSTSDGLGAGPIIPASEGRIDAHAIERTGLGWQIRRPDRSYYDGVWRARRIAVMACRTLNKDKPLPIAEWPDRLASDLRRKVKNR